MKTLLEIIRLSEGFLQQKGFTNARREAENVIADRLGLRRIDLYLQFERPLLEEELGKIREALKRRALREPLAYIAGKVPFFGIELNLSASVLIPRPETEILVEKIAQTLSQQPLEGKILWDMCCGSGCIGLSLKKHFPELTVIMSDISPEAVDLARLNSENNVEIRQGDLFNAFETTLCDFFVCNPPYVTEQEWIGLMPDVKDYEPKIALVGGVSGLEFYEKIAQSLASYLKIPGKGWLEIGTQQGESVKKIFEAKGFTAHYSSDWAGHDRFFFLENH